MGVIEFDDRHHVAPRGELRLVLATPLRLAFGLLRPGAFCPKCTRQNARPCTPSGQPACGRGGGARASRTRTSATSSGSARSGRGARTDSEPSRKSSSSGERTRERICAANHDLPFPRPHARAPRRPHARALGKPFHVRVPSIVGGTGGRRADAGASRESSLPGVELTKLHHKAAGEAAGAGGGGGPLGAPAAERRD